MGTIAALELTDRGKPSKDSLTYHFTFQLNDQTNEFTVYDVSNAGLASSDMPVEYQKLFETIRQAGDHTWKMFQAWQDHVEGQTKQRNNE